MRPCMKLLTVLSYTVILHKFFIFVSLLLIIYGAPSHCTKNFTCISHLIFSLTTVRRIYPF